ncbi:hypothetical protein HYC85_022402 [Camellia sinensis]|uniref:Uncharacterized protein n=1 Tax=Camellia sinensis TaxID=4442 RepID=A0A7J7GM11_CAMSI|nr:hypothetical protein HYC85_022402 [Camellia sinensis]
MDEKKEFVDLSSMMLFEATGDLEAISELNIAAVDAELMGAAEDDALSCSCDDLIDCELGKFDGLGHTHVEVYRVADHGDEEEEDIDQDWTDGGDDEVVMSSTAKAREHKKLRCFLQFSHSSSYKISGYSISKHPKCNSYLLKRRQTKLSSTISFLEKVWIVRFYCSLNSKKK